MTIPSNQITILRTLAAKYATIAFSDENLRNISAHRAVNDLHGARPIVLIDEIPWHEMELNSELTPVCTDPLFAPIEENLRRTLYKWAHLRVDMVVPPYIAVPKRISFSGIGVERAYADSETALGKSISSHKFKNLFDTWEDIQLLHNDTVTYDKTGSISDLAHVEAVLGGILPIKLCGVESGYGTACKMWDDLSFYMDLQIMLYKLIDEPDFMHALADKLCSITENRVHQYNELGLYEAGTYYNHCTCALTNDLPLALDHVTSHDVWGRGMAQIFASVSPAMHNEFDIEYQIRALANFGLNYYGCCEPLDRKLHIVQRIPNLRKISITPWADINLSADIIGKHYVLAAKPTPSTLCSPHLDEHAVRTELSQIVTAIRRNGCNADIVLKDITTVCHKPENLFRWAQIAMETVQG